MEAKQKHRVAVVNPGGNVEFKYPDNYTQQQRGFTPSGAPDMGVINPSSNTYSPYKLGRSKTHVPRIASQDEISRVELFRARMRIRLSVQLRNLYNLPAKIKFQSPEVKRRKLAKKEASAQASFKNKIKKLFGA